MNRTELIFPTKEQISSYSYNSAEEQKIVQQFFVKYKQVQQNILHSLPKKQEQHSYFPPQIIAVTKSQNVGVVAAIATLAPFLPIGENRVKAANEKVAAIIAARKKMADGKPYEKNLPINLHFIGRLQTNDVLPMLKTSCCLHSVDRMKLLQALEKRTLHMLGSGEMLAPLPVYLQVNTSHEQQKAGFLEEEAMDVLPQLLACRGIRFVGVMAMAKNTTNEKELVECFSSTAKLSQKLQSSCDELGVGTKHNFLGLSMGMSDDYSLAVGCGSTCVRVGSLLFS